MSAQNISADWRAITDEPVMAAVKAGSASAFEVLYDRYHERAFRIARAVCRDNGRAEEAVQEAFDAATRPPTSPFTSSGRPATSHNRPRHMPGRATC